jgi:2Fe-2S ferredoxin
MMKITANTQQGERRELTGKSGLSLMDVLQNEGLVEGTCGGMASCGTCHVFIGDDWAAKLAERTEDEGYMLESLEEMVEIRPASRLACQITLDDSHDGLSLEIAPQI